jgi:drug/metabolite transporter (DMT)-like permease
MLHEAVEWPEIAGGALVLLGVALTTHAPLSPRTAS